MLTPAFVIAVKSRCLRTPFVVLTNVFAIIAICHLHDIQNFATTHGYTLWGLIFDTAHES